MVCAYIKGFTALCQEVIHSSLYLENLTILTRKYTIPKERTKHIRIYHIKRKHMFNDYQTRAQRMKGLRHRNSLVMRLIFKKRSTYKNRSALVVRFIRALLSKKQLQQ